MFHLFGALAEFERAVIRKHTSAGLQAARKRGKVGGRPRSFGPKEIAAARALIADPTIRVEDVASHLKVSPTTLYRSFPGGRGGVLPAEQGHAYQGERSLLVSAKRGTDARCDSLVQFIQRLIIT